MADERHEWFLNQIFRHRAALHRYLRKFTYGAEDIEDLIQETYVRLYGLADYRAVDSPKALLFRIAHNLAVERARSRKTQATDSMADLEQLGVYSKEVPADEQLDSRRRFESFCAAVDGVSRSTIEKHVAKGLVRCRDHLRELGLLEVTEAKIKPAAPRRVTGGGDADE
jgi:RNA polymerase sigma-70 factor (ECF subfamily)